MVVYTVVFTVMQQADNGTVPNRDFPVFVLCALLPWNFFAGAVLQSIGSVADNAPLVKKVYFPREILPLSVVLSNLVNFGISLIVLFPMLLVFRVPLTPWALLLPVIILLQLCFVTGVSFLIDTISLPLPSAEQPLAM